MTNISWILKNYHEQYLYKNIKKKLFELVNIESKSEIWNKGLEYVSHNNNDTYFDLLSCDDEFDALEKRIKEMFSVIKNEKSSGRIADEIKWGEETEKFLLNDINQNYVKRLLTYKRGNRYTWKNVENKLK